MARRCFQRRREIVMCETGRLWSAFHEIQERVTELEARVSLLEDEDETLDWDGVTLEDWDDDAVDAECTEEGSDEPKS
jgi:hypothetical protein